MSTARDEIVASISRAKLELEDALEDLKQLPMLDPMVLGFITHALRNYLNVARGTVQLLGDALKGDPRKDIGIWLKGLREITTQMVRLVDAMHDPRRREVPQMKFEKIDFTLLVRRACEFYRRTAARKHIEIAFETRGERLPAVRADRVAVAAVLDNLLSNAVKFSPEGTRIRVEVERERAGAICRVSDEGPGIAAADRAKLFQRGARLKAKPTNGESSHGYGLAVAAELVAHLGGEIGCESSPGKGACFYFCLPCSRGGRGGGRIPKRPKSSR